MLSPCMYWGASLITWIEYGAIIGPGVASISGVQFRKLFKNTKIVKLKFTIF